MATINDFKIVKQYSKHFFETIYADSINEYSNLDKERFGFYYLVLEKITGVTDSDDITGMIQDDKFNKVLFNNEEDDLGIDAIYIDKSDEVNIKLFNFKYRENFNPDKTTSENDLQVSSKFLQAIEAKSISSKIDKKSKVYNNLKRIREYINSNEICNMQLILVTNEANGFDGNCYDKIENFKEKYGLEVRSISLDDICADILIKKNDYFAKVFINNNDLFIYKSDAKSTDTSYMCKISLLDLIRISCTDEKLRNKYNLEDDQQILNCKLQTSILYDNVRGYLGETRYNKNIIKTISTEPTNFFLFNNGITMICDELTSEPKNSNKKYLLTIKNCQIVNGGQTIKTIYSYLNNNIDKDKICKLSEAFILVRLFLINKSSDLKNQIAEYTNSQNKISSIDLKSVTKIQTDIEKYFDANKILYVRKKWRNRRCKKGIY